MGGLSWCWWPRNKNKSLDNAELSKRFEGGDRRHLLQALSAMVGGGALAVMSQSAEARDSSDLPPPKRVLTGRDEAGKSVFKSFDVTPKVVAIDANPGLTFYELYMTEGVPRLTGLEPDPMLKGTKAFPGPGGTMFRLISYPPKRPEGWKPPPGVTFESGLRELSEKVPRMGDYFDRDAPAGRRTEGPFAPRRLRRAKRNPTSLAQPVAGALSHGLHLDWRDAWLMK